MASQVGTHSNQPPKFSRYRSVRKAQNAGANGFHSVAAAPPPIPTEPNISSAGIKSQNESIQRSMSRYRRTKPTTGKTSIPAPPLPTSTRRNRQAENGYSGVEAKWQNENYPKGKEYQLQHENEPISFQPNHSSAVNRPSTRDNRPLTSSRDKYPNQETVPKASMDQTSSGGTSPRYPMKELYVSKIAERLSPTKPTIGAEDQRICGIDREGSVPTSPIQQHMRSHETAAPLDINRNTQDERRANEIAMSKHNKPNASKKLMKEKGGFLSRIRTTMDTETDPRSHQESIKTLRDKISPPQLVESKDPAIGPGVDAPISAVNAGERTVLVTCNDSFINLPVTPTTQAKDILNSAKNCLPENISPQFSIVQESFKKLGLERPIRRYERVRDVMNSWDNDTQNHLVIVTTPDDDVNDSLHVTSAPRKQPSDSSFHLYHSQKPGKWEKRWITLRSDGQVTVAKKPGSESTNICHLSDFDMYSPTRREHKKIRPPKKMCFAVKSQQKSAMFLTTENFVHYFCTNDGDVGSLWHAAIQQWRSWYLINVLGAGDNQDESGIPPATKETQPDAAGINSVETKDQQPNPRGISEEAHHHPSSFKPLLENLPSVRHGKARQPLASAPSSPRKTTFGTDRDIFRRRGRSKTTTSRKEADSEPEPFATTGLLGRTYTQRHNAMRKRDKEEREKEFENNGPFTAQGLLRNIHSAGPTSPTSRSFSDQIPRSGQHSSGQSSRENTIRGGETETVRSHSKSTRQKPKPLVDLAPAYQEPPQHVRKGRGITTEPGLPLVEGATGPELHPGAIIVPSASTWRKPSQAGGGGGPNSPLTSEHFPTQTAAATKPLSRATSRRQRSNTYRSNNNNSTHRSPQQMVDSRQLPSLNTTPTSPPSSGTAANTTQSPPTQDSPFSPTGLLALSGRTTTTQGAAHTGRGIATGDRNQSGRPLLDLTQQSQFVTGSLLRSVEAQRSAVENERGVAMVDRERREEY